MREGILKIRISGGARNIKEAAERYGLRTYRQRNEKQTALYMTANADAAAVIWKIREAEDGTAIERKGKAKKPTPEQRAQAAGLNAIKAEAEDKAARAAKAYRSGKDRTTAALLELQAYTLRQALSAYAKAYKDIAGEPPNAANACGDGQGQGEAMSAEGLRTERRRAGLSQIQLAKAAGVSLATISHAEQGRTAPSKETAARIRAAIETAIDEAKEAKGR